MLLDGILKIGLADSSACVHNLPVSEKQESWGHLDFQLYHHFLRQGDIEVSMSNTNLDSAGATRLAQDTLDNPEANLS